MKEMKEIVRLTDLEIKIMKVLWDKERCLTIQEIADYLNEDKISVASVSQVIKHLISKKAIQVKEYVLVSNVYARTFYPCFSPDDYFVAELTRMKKSMFGRKKLDALGIIAALLSNSDEHTIDKKELLELQKIIDLKKEQMKRVD